jgi:hypothetical protein
VRQLVLVLSLLALSGCARVMPWQRGDHARPSMTGRFGERTRFGAAYRSKVMETKAAGGLAGVAPGGGCGCSQ